MNSQAIELKGIVRNQTKIGVQDGQCDDIVNLRFKDGSWRVSDDGKNVYAMSSDAMYKDLYVHTVNYHHLLGVNPNDNKLYWFANIDNDGETFKSLATPVEICAVQGDNISISQIGNIIIVTDSIKLTYSMFADDEYKILNYNDKKVQTDRKELLNIHFNLYSEYAGKYTSFKRVSDTAAADLSVTMKYLTQFTRGSKLTNEFLRDIFVSCIGEIRQKNLFLKPFLALGAVKLYDGTWVAATNPVLLFHGEVCLGQKKYIDTSGIAQNTIDPYATTGKCYVDALTETGEYAYALIDNGAMRKIHKNITPNITFGVSKKLTKSSDTAVGILDCIMHGSEMIITLPDGFECNEVIKGFGIFITPESTLYKEEEGKNTRGNLIQGRFRGTDSDGEVIDYQSIGYYAERKPDSAIIDELMHSGFYLIEEFTGRKEAGSYKINLADKPQGYLNNLVQYERLPNEAFDRNVYIPKITYVYNTKLHIADYVSSLFSGFPIDSFQLSNHSVALSNDSYAVGNTLKGLEEFNYIQYPRIKTYFASPSESHMTSQDVSKYISNAIKQKTYFAQVTAVLETDNGESRVVRYVQPYESDSFNKGDKANFVESISPLVVYPDARAKSIDILIVELKEGTVRVHGKEFKLTAHPYLNIAYYIEPELKPIDIPELVRRTVDNFNEGVDINLFQTYEEKNTTVHYPNGIKVAQANNPFFFPYENTYQVGNAEIVSLMSNAVSVGTGQTGAAPLYVFCKDGIYALLVDSSGEMTYTNARIIARDVCNNAKSVTPIDSGVVFTTDRGLMSIAGSEVVEIGSAAEGDVFDITDTSDKAKKIMFNAFTMQQLAELPQTLIDNTDFLTYLKGAIVNYNHNERELMVSNPDKDYTYVMDRNGNWSRRAFTAQEYVNNYPTSYRIDKSGKLYKVDADDNETNQVYLLSNVIKLGSIAFKKAYTLVVRGDFNLEKGVNIPIENVDRVYDVHENTGSITEPVTIELYNNKDKTYKEGTYKMDIEYLYRYFNVTRPNSPVVTLQIYGTNPFGEEGIDDLLYKETLETITGTFSPQITLSKLCKLRVNIIYNAQRGGNNSLTVYPFSISKVKSKDTLGLYAFGSYDGRQWSLLGGNEKSGKFTDIGCKIAHTGIKFIRICMAGKISHASRIDFVEISYDDSNLNTKLR